jgi:hypothetical protein
MGRAGRKTRQYCREPIQELSRERKGKEVERKSMMRRF